MTKISRFDALAKLNSLHIPLDVDFHALPNDAVCRLVDAAKAEHYRKPKNANGSTARYYHARLMRAANAQASC